MTKELDFNSVTDKEMEKIVAISKRAFGLGVTDTMSTQMDIIATNQVAGLDLDILLGSDDFNFIHDICGIARHLNRKTFELEGCFVPRCIKK